MLAADHVRQGPARATTAATPSTPRKIARELGWRPQETFEPGMRTTVALVSRQPALGRSGVTSGDTAKLASELNYAADL